jgi:hypothetical protein
MNAWEREEDALVEQFNNGEISRKEFDQEMRELHQDMRAAANEAAQEAYDQVMENW